ncbi:MAG: SBBP repeat-containing protein [Bryobacterales bacterium]|nr:SBBP repeat-containing protein [Bryobacterales bacterium]MBV9396456.1 SBBP repeat-containing protein [Bryobacterales bacterium]
MEGLGPAAPSTYFRRGTARSFRQFPSLAVRGLYPGINVQFHDNGGNLEYDLNIAANASPDRVCIRLTGGGPIHIDAAGGLTIETASGVVRQTRPGVFQSNHPVDARYVLVASNEVGIRLGKYNRGLPLTIDPVLVRTTYFGGSGVSAASLLATDSEGNIYVVGRINSIDFPTTANGFEPKIAPPLLALSTPDRQWLDCRWRRKIP